MAGKVITNAISCASPYCDSPHSHESGNPFSELFPSVVGQTGVKQKILKILQSDRMAHAYLFVGQQGTGRLAMALEMARVLNCAEKNSVASAGGCLCKPCRNVIQWNHPNIYPIFPLPRLDLDDGEAAAKTLQEFIETKRADIYTPLKLTGTGRILIDQIRELRKKLSLSMDRSGVRVVIAQPAERVRDESANAFLKLLEEPPDRCCLVLISESLRDLLPTVVSRCQTIRFAPLSVTDIAAGLQQKHGIDSSRAVTAARLAGGNFARAVALTEGDTAEKLNESLEFLRAAAVGNPVKITAMVDAWSGWTERSQIDEKLSYTAMWIKDAIAWKSFGSEQATAHLDVAEGEDTVERMANRYTHEQLQRAWVEIETSRQAVDANTNIPLALTVLALRLNRTLK